MKAFACLAIACLIASRTAMPASAGTTAGSAPSFLKAVGGRLFFGTYDEGSGGWALWTSTPDDAAATLLSDGLGLDLELASVGATLYFGTRAGLWRSDGTIDGTAQVAPLPFFPHALKNVAGVSRYCLTFGGVVERDRPIMGHVPGLFRVSVRSSRTRSHEQNPSGDVRTQPGS
jgi:hypothetical protein